MNRMGGIVWKGPHGVGLDGAWDNHTYEDFKTITDS
jgi:hypothetical protein